MSRVLVTGGAGFIGRRVLVPLVAAGHEVHAVSRRDQGRSGGVTWHTADLLSSAAVVERVRPEVLVHLAWYAEHGRFWTATENLCWVEASLALLRAFARGDGRRAVLAGTCAEYDWTVGDGILREATTPSRPATLYGAAKQAVFSTAEAYGRQAGFELTSGRVFFLYGADEAPGRLVAAVARSLLAGEPARTTAGTQVRDFLHVDDVGGAFAALVDSTVSGAVNIGSGQGVALREVIEAVADAAGRPDLVELGALAQRPGEPERLVADVGRLRDEVGFRPSVGLHEGLRKTVDALRA